MRAQGLQVRVPDPAAKPVQECRVHRYLRRAVGEVHEVEIVNVDLADIGGEVPNDRFVKQIQRALARLVQHFEAVEQAPGSEIPVHRPLIAAAVVRIDFDETVERAAGLLDRLDSALSVGFNQQHGAEAVGGTPGRPVPRLFTLECHPPVVVVCQVGLDQPCAHFMSAYKRVIGHAGRMRP